MILMMMLNLFSIFDPHTFLNMSLNWFSSFLIILLLPSIYWILLSRLIYFFDFFIKKLWSEYKTLLLNKFNYLNLVFYVVLFMFILMNNFLGLYPYIFTSSSHMIFSVSFALSMWLGLMFFGWLKNTFHMFVHLLPQGTPVMLMLFMVLIELLSNVIRPLTLSIRLTANMIAGHLLLVLLAGAIPDFYILFLIVLFFQILLLILEISVSIIQSYVFVILLILYFKETN